MKQLGISDILLMDITRKTVQKFESCGKNIKKRGKE